MRVSSVSSEESEEERFQLLEFVEKTAVENDDSSTSENFSSFMFEDETFTDKRSSQTQIKHEKCGEYFLVQFMVTCNICEITIQYSSEISVHVNAFQTS